jgi:hypothetical protein
VTECIADSECMSGDTFDRQPWGLTALSAMQMYGPQLAAEWHNRDFGITLLSHRGNRRVSSGNMSARLQQPHPKTTGEVDFQNNLLMASRDESNVSPPRRV